MAAEPQEIFEALTQPDAIARWAPIPFELVELDGEHLRTGGRARVRGELAGRQLAFDVAIHEANGQRLSLAASGPVSVNAEYELSATGGGSYVRASVSVHGSGLLGRILAGGIETLLAGGALRASVARIGRDLEPALAAQRHELRSRRPSDPECRCRGVSDAGARPRMKRSRRCPASTF